MAAKLEGPIVVANSVQDQPPARTPFFSIAQIEDSLGGLRDFIENLVRALRRVAKQVTLCARVTANESIWRRDSREFRKILLQYRQKTPVERKSFS